MCGVVSTSIEMSSMANEQTGRRRKQKDSFGLSSLFTLFIFLVKNKRGFGKGRGVAIAIFCTMT